MDYQKLLDLTEKILILRGGKGSGNWGHKGRKGKRGGSGKGGGKIDLSLKDAIGRMSTTSIVSLIDSNSQTSLDLRKLKKQVSDAAPFNLYGKTTVKVSQLKIQDKETVLKNIKKFGTSTNNNPIVIDNDGFVIDGRHRAVQAILNGQGTILAYAPIMKKK